MSIKLDEKNGNIIAGGNGADGDVVLFPDSGDNKDAKTATILLEGQGGNIFAGGNGADGDIVVFPANADHSKFEEATIHINGNEGDIILQNADAAEDFEVEENQVFEPGTVMVISNNSKLKRSNQAYDRKVAGIVAGAGNLKPGIILGRDRRRKNSLPIALMGRVYCKVNTSNGPIEIGDLLTTSEQSGFAMRATDPMKAFGAVIGKALQPLSTGSGMVPVLVALQ